MKRNEHLINDSNLCYEYLSNIYKDEIKSKEFKRIHKIAYIYLELDNLLDSDESKKFYKEILSNIIYMMYSIKTLTEKTVNMLNRNTIDNLLKICKLKYTLSDDFRKKHIEDKFKDIKYYNSFNEIGSYCKVIDFLLNEYKEACGYIHSTKDKYLDLCDNLKEYTLYEIDYNKLDRFYKRVLFLLLVVYEKDLKSKNFEKKSIIRGYVEKEYLKEYLNYFYDARF